MSLLPADEITDADIVADAFLSLRGAGLVLSPVDVELLRGYEASGVPPQVLVRALLKVAERRQAHGKPLPRSLVSLRRSLNAAARQHQAGQVQGGALPASTDEIDRAIAAIREAATGPERAAWRAAYRALCAGEDADAAAALGFLAALPRDEQRAFANRVVRGTLGPRPADEPRGRYRERLRAALLAGAQRLGAPRRQPGAG